MKDCNAFVTWLARNYPKDHERIVGEWEAAVAASIQSFGAPELVSPLDELTAEQITVAIEATIARWQPQIDAYNEHLEAALVAVPGLQPLLGRAREWWADLQERMAEELDPLTDALKKKTQTQPVENADLSKYFKDDSIKH